MTTITIYQGDDDTINLLVLDNNSAAIDITGYTFWFTVKSIESDSDAEALIQKVVTSHTAPVSGITAIELSNVDTSIPASEYIYDIQMKDTADKIKTLVKGTFVIESDVTDTNV